MSVKYEVDYNDPRLKSARDGEADELKESDALYDSMVSDIEGQYDKLIDAAGTNKDTQTQLQQDQTDFTISQIEQQKEQSEKDYQKEQSAAYTDYQKQIDPYGVNAEQMATQGMSGSGYNESSKVRMYNAYQNRVAVARDVAERAKVEYDNAMTEARLQNSSALAEIAAATYETQLKLSLESFQQQNSLILQKVGAQNAIKTKYDNKWLDVLDQINTENALSEEARQFDVLHPQDKGIDKDEEGKIDGDDNNDLTPEYEIPTARTTGLAKPIPVFSDREQAISYLRDNYNIPNANSIYTHSQWNKLKKSGTGPEMVKDSSSYGEYLQLHSEFLIDQFAQ